MEASETPVGKSVEGGCLCGGVRFSAELPALFCAHCHCHWCRRAHGAVFVTWFGVPETKFTLTKGEGSVRWYASSEASARGSCSICGTMMFFRSKAAAGEMHIALACADGPIDRAPKAHIFYSDRVPWFEPNDDLPKCDRDHPSLSQYKTIARKPGSSL